MNLFPDSGSWVVVDELSAKEDRRAPALLSDPKTLKRRATTPSCSALRHCFGGVYFRARTTSRPREQIYLSLQLQNRPIVTSRIYLSFTTVVSFDDQSYKI